MIILSHCSGWRLVNGWIKFLVSIEVTADKIMVLALQKLSKKNIDGKIEKIQRNKKKKKRKESQMIKPRCAFYS